MEQSAAKQLKKGSMCGCTEWLSVNRYLLDNNLANHASSLVRLTVVSVCAWL